MQTSTEILTSRFEGPFGSLLVRTRGDVVHALRRWRPEDGVDPGDPPPLIRAASARYFDGEGGPIDLAVDAVGTPFQCLIWSAMAAIGWGELTTYAALADDIGRPGCARPVGQAVAAHPASLLVGGHRVLSAGGRITGVDSDAVAWKSALLRLEGHVVDDGRVVQPTRTAA